MLTLQGYAVDDVVVPHMDRFEPAQWRIIGKKTGMTSYNHVNQLVLFLAYGGESVIVVTNVYLNPAGFIQKCLLEYTISIEKRVSIHDSRTYCDIRVCYEGHPDKIADHISDGILDAALEQDPQSRVACETLVTTGLIVIAGEITTRAHINYADTAARLSTILGITMPTMVLTATPVL